MSCLYYRNTELFIENVSLKTIADHFGTPSYVYSRALIENNWRAFDNAFTGFPHRICYAVKANSNIAILQLLAKLNSGFDIVSLGELERVLAAGGDPKKTVFSGVGKRENEIEQALHYGIHCFNVESRPELTRLQKIGKKLNKKIPITLRINPDVNPHTHEHISTGLKENKFGIAISDIIPVCHTLTSMPALQLIGIACHIGSQITDLTPFLLATEQLLSLYSQLKALNISLQHINLGGGLGITYRDERPPSVNEYVQAVKNKLSNLPLETIIEPGRAIVGNAGVLLTKIEYLKHLEHKNFAIVDAGMNDLLRPALYDAWQNILPATLRHAEKKTYDIAGPICESADFLGKNRELAIQENDLLAVDCAGAYGFSMSSNYNSRCRPAEVLIDNDKMYSIRKRETLSELFAHETLPL
jgi:diaminopimelate decarboxylase